MVHITDVLAVSMMLGITAQVKEAGIAWDKGEKKSKAPGLAVVGASVAAGCPRGPGRGREGAPPRHSSWRPRELVEPAGSCSSHVG